MPVIASMAIAYMVGSMAESRSTRSGSAGSARRTKRRRNAQSKQADRQACRGEPDQAYQQQAEVGSPASRNSRRFNESVHQQNSRRSAYRTVGDAPHMQSEP
jgi:hypothetical protein